MARSKLDLVLLPAQRQELQRLLKAPATPQKLVRRARIVLLARAGKHQDRANPPRQSHHRRALAAAVCRSGARRLGGGPAAGPARHDRSRQGAPCDHRSGPATAAPGALE